MKKMIKICAVTGLVLLVLGICVTTVSSALGGTYRNSFPARLWSRFWHNHTSWTDDWDDWDDCDDWDDDPRWQHWNGDGRYGSTQDNPAPLSKGTGAPDSASLPEPVPQPEPSPDQAAAAAPGAADPSGRTGAPGAERQGSDPSFAWARRLDIDVDKGVIHVSEKEGIAQIEIHVRDDYNMTKCYMDEETLKIKRESTNRSNDAPYIQVLVPSGYELEKLSLDMGAAECSILNITTSKLEIDTGVGAVSFTGTVNGSLEIETGVGDVTLNLTGPQSGYNYQVECGVGSINVGSDHYSLLSHETRINNNAPYTMELECGVGNINVNFDWSV